MDKPTLFRKTLLHLLDDYERLFSETHGLHLATEQEKGYDLGNGHASEPELLQSCFALLDEKENHAPPCSVLEPFVPACSESSNNTAVRDADPNSEEPHDHGAQRTQGLSCSERSGRSVFSSDLKLHKRSQLLRRVSTGTFFRRKLVNWMEDPLFERLVGLVIFANVIFMGVCADYEIKNLDSPHLQGSSAIELIFCILYTVELGLRLFVWRLRFFEPPDRGWNCFDLMLVIQSIYEQVVSYTNFTTGSGNISFLRSMRLLKMLKMLRVIRLMRSMFELRIILTSIMGSLKSMFWSLVLLTVVLYMFSLIFVQASANYLTSEMDAGSKDELLHYWGSLLQGMQSLYSCSTGGRDWQEVADPLMDVSVAFFVVFCLYIAFFTFVILNTITALFVEATINNSMKDYQANIQTELEKKDEYVDKLQLLFDEMDDTGDGLVTMEEFSSRMSDPRMRAFAHTLGIEISDTSHFFGMLSDSGQKPVDLDTFVTGCIRMKGQALSIDLQDLLIKQTRLTDVLERRLHDITQKVTLMDVIERRLQHISSELLPYLRPAFRSHQGLLPVRRPSKDSMLGSMSQSESASQIDSHAELFSEVTPKLTL